MAETTGPWWRMSGQDFRAMMWRKKTLPCIFGEDLYQWNVTTVYPYIIEFTLLDWFTMQEHGVDSETLKCNKCVCKAAVDVAM